MQFAENEKRWAVTLFAVLVWVPLALLVMKLAWDEGFYRGYDPALPLATQIELTHEDGVSRRWELRFQGVEGVTVPAIVHAPSGEGPWPTVIFLHGIGQSGGFVDEIAGPFVEAGFAIASFDQHGRGERARRRGVLGTAFTLRRRSALTVIETRRLLDALEGLPWVDASRIYLVGASYGAMTGAAAAAKDQRLRTAVLVYGGGDLRVLLDSPAAREAAGALHLPARWFLVCLMAPADPIRHVGRISPRPILMFSGAQDTLVPPESAQALYQAAAEPKEIIWLESEHIGGETALVMQVIDETIRFLKEQPAQAP